VSVQGARVTNARGDGSAMDGSHSSREQRTTSEARHPSRVAAPLLSVLLAALVGCGGRVIRDEATIGGATNNGGTGGTPVSGGGEGGAGASGAAASVGGSMTGGATTNGGAGGTPTGGTGGTSTGGTGAITYGIPGPSCDSLTGTECQGESCCTTILVPGGTFMMGRSEAGSDAFASGTYDVELYATEQPEHSVTVDSYYLDKYEVTVGRFRAFVDQYAATPPTAGAGAPPTIPGTGWDSAWDRHLPATQADLMATLRCWNSATWTDAADASEAYAINCVSGYEAQAFWAWDGGRLPTEAEWEYAAAGGDENRLYPWGSAAPDATLANCYDGDYTPFLAVGSKPLGAGRWGQHDLAGGVREWAFDWHDGSWYSNASATGQNPCNVTAASDRVTRGGSWATHNEALRAACRINVVPDHDFSHSYVGFRCARNP